MKSRDYDDVPGTYVLDSRSYRKGYHLNMFCMSLNKAECREEFARDERAYLEKFPMTEEQRQAVLDRDYIGMLKLGANVYYTFKIVSHDRQPPQVPSMPRLASRPASMRVTPSSTVTLCSLPSGVVKMIVGMMLNTPLQSSAFI